MARSDKLGTRGFTLLELLVSISVIAVLVALILTGARVANTAASLAISANNIRQLAAGAAAYLGDNNYVYWKFKEYDPNQGMLWWFGGESPDSLRAGEGNRYLDLEEGPLGGYIPAGLKPDPSFTLAGKPFKPKYKFGYIGVGYNILLANDEGDRRAAWRGVGTPVRHMTLSDPGKVVVFATSAQVNTFQRPATRSNPMIEEFYGIDDVEVTVHFRHHGRAMVAFADGTAGFLDIDESTRNNLAPEACIGRFAPRGNSAYLK